MGPEGLRLRNLIRVPAASALGGPLISKEVLVVGATGTVGGMIARRLVHEGHRVRALARPATDAQLLEASRVKVVRGDMKEPATLARACEGVRVVVSTANSASRAPPDTVESVDRDGNAALVEAARHAGVERFVFVSVLGATVGHPVPFYDAKARTEAALRASGMEYTILSPTMFMEVWAALIVGMPIATKQPVTLVGKATNRHSFVSNADVAMYAVKSVTADAARNASVALGGPAAVSWRDVVATYERALGRSVETRFIAPGELIPNLPPVFSEFAAGMEQFESIVDMGKTAEIFGVPPTPLESFVRGSVR